MFKKKKSIYLIIFAMTFVIWVALILWLKSLPFSRSEVINISDDQTWNWNPQSSSGVFKVGNIEIDFNSGKTELNGLKSLIEPLRNNPSSDWEKALKVKEWVHNNLRHGIPTQRYNWYNWTPYLVLEDAKNEDFRENCGTYAKMMTVGCLSVGLPARLIEISTDIYKKHNPYVGEGSHVATEIWIREFNKWVFMDSLYTHYYIIGGTPASSLDIHKALLSDRIGDIRIVASDSDKDLFPKKILSWFRHIIIVDPDAYLKRETPWWSLSRWKYLHWVDKNTPPYGLYEKRLKLLITLIFPCLVVGLILLYLRQGI